jgi:hypothetical protein
MEKWTAAVRHAAQCLEDNPSQALVSAIGEIAEWIWYYEHRYRAAPICIDYRSRITELKNATDVLAKALDRTKRSAGTEAAREVNDAVDSIVAQWVARDGGLDAKRLWAFSRGLAATIDASSRRGNYRVSDINGAPRGRMFCAVAATELWAVVRGKTPGWSNTKLHDFCGALWGITEVNDPEGGRWERPLRDVLEGRYADVTTVVGGQLATANDQIRSVLRDHGLQ